MSTKEQKQNVNIEIPVPIIRNNKEFSLIWDSIVERDREGHSDVTFIYFGALWCGPCHIWKPSAMKFMRDLQKEKKADCYEIDIDTCPQGAGWCNVKNIPAIVKFRGKRLMNTWVGESLKTILSREE